MNVLIKLLVCAVALLLCKNVAAQTDTLYLSTAQAENLFIQHNLELIAERLNIDIADAEIMQARLWNNPTLSIEDANIWTTEDFRDEMENVLPPGAFAPRRQFAIGIEQIITTGGKRRKLIAVEQVSRHIAEQYFEELLRSLKAELRNTFAETLFLQEYRQVLENQHEKLSAFIGSYRNQMEQGNVSRSELMRLQAALLEIQSEINEWQRDMNEQQKELKILLNISTPSYIVLTATDRNFVSPNQLSFNQLIDLSEMQRPDMREALFQQEYFEKTLRYERAQRVPDLALSAHFDRAGGVGRNFVSFGVSMDIPLFDRNQGNIRAAQIGITQSQTLVEQKRLEIHNELLQAMRNYTLAYDFNQQITDDFVEELNEMLHSVTRNFANRNISMLEFLDFFEVYKDNKRTVLEARRDLKISFEELQFAVGTEISKQVDE